MQLLLSPHNDDAVLFASFTLIRESPQVVVCFDGYLQGARGESVTWHQRRCEDTCALHELSPTIALDFLGVPDHLGLGEVTPRCEVALREWDTHYPWSRVWAPAVEEGGNAQHNLIGQLADTVFGAERVRHYMTYTTAGKSTSSTRVAIENGDWVARKLRALAHYTSQLNILNCRPHFLREHDEYYA